MDQRLEGELNKCWYMLLESFRLIKPNMRIYENKIDDMMYGDMLVIPHYMQMDQQFE